MGLLVSVVISYAGIREAIECFKHIVSGLVPDAEPDFEELVRYYNALLQKSANSYSNSDWTRECGQGYLCLTQDKEGKLKSAAVKYYDGKPDSTAILFSTKISSFGQESVESAGSQANGDVTERYTPSTTKTIMSNTSESFSVGYRNRSPTPSEHVSDPNRFSATSFERDDRDAEDSTDAKEKLTWHYRPLSPTPQPLPEIHFQSYEGDHAGDAEYSEEFLRSLDGIKYRPLQRNDPSGRRRSFKKRHSSSSTSSRDSRASREEELKMFTSLEEAEFARMVTNDSVAGFGSAPNLAARSHSRSRSRENSKEKSWSMDASVDSVELDDERNAELKPRLKDLPKLSSFEEEKEETKDATEVTEEGEDDDVDFWGSSGE